MRGLTFLVLGLLAAAAYVVIPYLLLAGIASFAASYLFWSVLTIAGIIGAIVYTRRWRDA